MFAILKQILFGSRFALSEKAHAEKSAALEELLGPVYDEVNEAIERNDLCYFARCLPGTAVATCHLIQASGNTAGFLRRPIPYELVAFTRHSVEQLDTDDAVAEFQSSVGRITYILDTVGRYSTVDTLKPGSCCEVPARRGERPGYLVFLEYTRDNKRLTIAGRVYSLLLCIEVFEEEMYYARVNGVAALVEKLTAAGCYPYSDLDRSSVV
ncbi:MAG TPA: suppressor of fused domain protein [Firmicutes bacterium]|nr:suppressor of fused domain protein [Bacillota bacterium]